MERTISLTMEQRGWTEFAFLLENLHEELDNDLDYWEDQDDKLQVEAFKAYKKTVEHVHDTVISQLPRNWRKFVPHQHDPEDHDCRYVGMDIWACGHVSNPPAGSSPCDCACCSGICQEV